MSVGMEVVGGGWEKLSILGPVTPLVVLGGGGGHRERRGRWAGSAARPNISPYGVGGVRMGCQCRPLPTWLVSTLGIWPPCRVPAARHPATPPKDAGYVQ